MNGKTYPGTLSFFPDFLDQNEITIKMNVDVYFSTSCKTYHTTHKITLIPIESKEETQKICKQMRVEQFSKQVKQLDDEMVAIKQKISKKVSRLCEVG